MYSRKVINDKVFKYLFLLITILSSLVIIFATIFILVKGISPFTKNYQINNEFYRVNPVKFITGFSWFTFPNDYGVGYIILNTIYVVFFATLISVPIAVLTALFIVKMAPNKIGKGLLYIVELLASVPSVIYGLFGVGFITQLIKFIASIFNYQSAGGLSNMASILVLSLMITPTITLLSATAIKSVDPDLEKASLALGASPTQTNFKVVLRAARSGIFAGVILGVGRALGEATAVSLVAGNAGSGPNFHPFEITRTLTSTMLLGLHESSGLDYDIRFSVGIILILVIILSNVLLNLIKKKVINKWV